MLTHSCRARAVLTAAAATLVSAPFGASGVAAAAPTVAAPAPAVVAAPEGTTAPTAVAPPATGADADYDYALTGNARISNARIKGTIPLRGTAAAQLSPSGAVTADVRLDPVVANLKEFGVIPIKAKVAFETTGPATGQLTAAGGLTITTNATIRLLRVNVLGLDIVQGSPRCRTRRPSVVTLTAPAFTPQTGGTLAGRFAISEMVDCGLLTLDLTSAMSTNRNVATMTLSR